MKKLTNKEKEIMDLYWQHGPMFVKELLEYYDEPRPHFNTLSTMVRILEKEGYLVSSLVIPISTIPSSPRLSTVVNPLPVLSRTTSITPTSQQYLLSLRKRRFLLKNSGNFSIR